MDSSAIYTCIGGGECVLVITIIGRGGKEEY